MRRGKARAARAIVALAAICAVGATGALSAEPGSEAARKKPAGCRAAKSATSIKVKNRRLRVKRTTCRAGRRVARRYTRRCLRSIVYSTRFLVNGFGNPGCKVSAARRRWRCSSIPAGGPGTGMLSAVRCRARRKQVRFRAFVSSKGPDPRFGGVAGVAAGGGGAGTAGAAQNPYKPCGIDDSIPGRIAVDSGIYQFRGIGPAAPGAEEVAKRVEALNVTGIYHAGLNSYPRGYPPRKLPVYIVPESFNLGPEAAGITSHTCANGSVDATASRLLIGSYGAITAHEIFHAFAGGLPGGATASSDSWWEEASAEWAITGLGAKVYPNRDPAFLQAPTVSLDRYIHGDLHQYGAWRFIRWLDLQGLIGAGSWHTHQYVFQFPGNTEKTVALRDALGAQGTTLAFQLARFWASHLHHFPIDGGPRTVGKEFVIGPTTGPPEEFEFPAGRLSAFPVDFLLTDRVKHVSFTFDNAPAGTRLFGLPDGAHEGAPKDPTDLSGDTLSFCVDGPGTNSRIWPGFFPVTFVNGNLGEGEKRVKVEIDASTSDADCPTTDPSCRYLQGFEVAAVFQVAAPVGDCDFGTVHVMCEKAGDANAQIECLENSEIRGVGTYPLRIKRGKRGDAFLRRIRAQPDASVLGRPALVITRRDGEDAPESPLVLTHIGGRRVFALEVAAPPPSRDQASGDHVGGAVALAKVAVRRDLEDRGVVAGGLRLAQRLSSSRR